MNPNLSTLPPDELVGILTASGLDAMKFADGREWVHPNHLGHVDAGVKQGREAEFALALASMDDEGTRRLVAQAGHRGVRTPEFKAALVEWVRERLVRALPIPDSVHREWSPLPGKRT